MADQNHMKRQVYKDPRPPETFDAHHERVRRAGPGWIYEVVRITTVGLALPLFRLRGYGAENVPNGPVIMAPNHASFMDHFFAGGFVRRHIQFMAKSQMFGSHPMSWVYSHGGVFPVRRGYGDEESMLSACAILDRGGAIGMYVEGGRSRSGAVGTEAKAGIGRLALETGAPIVPVAMYGTNRVRHWVHLKFPRIVVRYGRPLRFEPVENSTREQQQQVADEVLRRIAELHAELEAAGPKHARAAARKSVLAERESGS